MSGKNRAFALAVATAALVGLSAPVASAATSQGSPSGFNNDSVFNLSGNQLPVQTCTTAPSANAVTDTQALSAIASLVPILTTGPLSTTQNSTCSQSTAETNSSSVNS